MLDIGAEAGPDPKCYFTSTQLPRKIEDKQLPTKKSPFSTINAHAFNHTVQILLPTPLEQHHASSVEQRLHTILQGKRYAKVHLKPADLIHGDFFNQYIKAGNVIMRSQGRLGVDNIFLLHDGTIALQPVSVSRSPDTTRDSPYRARQTRLRARRTTGQADAFARQNTRQAAVWFV